MIAFERKPPGAEDSKAGGTDAQIRWLDDPRDSRGCRSNPCGRRYAAGRTEERHKRHPAAVPSDKAPGCLHLQPSFGAIHARLTCEARRDPTVTLTTRSRLYVRRSLRPHDCFRPVSQSGALIYFLSEASLATSAHLAISLLRKAASFSGEAPT